MRRLTIVALSAILFLAACRDQEPTAPTVPSPDQLSTTKCGAIPFPLLTVLSQINEVFPNGRLKIEATGRAGAIKLYWDTCKPAPARTAAVEFIAWMNEHFDRGRLRGATAQEVQTLTVTILNGVGVAVTAPTATGDIGVGIYDGEKTVIKTASEVALTEIEADAFADGQPRLIVVQRKGDAFQLHSFAGDQFPPYFDYDATKLEGPTVPADKALAPNKFAIIAFCLLPQTEEFQYPDQPRIGHNPVAGADPDAFEILDPVALVAGADGENRQDLRGELKCENIQENPGGGGGPILLRGLGGGWPDLAQAAFGKAGRIFGPLARSLLLPEPLSATAATAMVGFSGPIGGKTTSLSPFGVVDPGSANELNLLQEPNDHDSENNLFARGRIIPCREIRLDIGGKCRDLLVQMQNFSGTPVGLGTIVTASLIVINAPTGSTPILGGDNTQPIENITLNPSGEGLFPAATFADLAIDLPGRYQLKFEAPGAAPVISEEFDVYDIAFTLQPVATNNATVVEGQLLGLAVDGFAYPVVQVSILDYQNVVVPGTSDFITIITPVIGLDLQGDSRIRARDGVANFTQIDGVQTGLSIDISLVCGDDPFVGRHLLANAGGQQISSFGFSIIPSCPEG